MGATRLRRSFSTFPGGWTGSGLLLLRATLGLSFISQGVLYILYRHSLTLLAWIISVLAIVSGALLLIGHLTAVPATIASLNSVTLWLMSRSAIAQTGVVNLIVFE